MTISINGKAYRYAFTMLQMEKMNELIAQHTAAVEQGACLPFTAIQMAARQDRRELDIDFEDVLNWYDDALLNDTEELKDFNRAYMESTVYKRFIEPNLSEEQKKSLLTLTSAEPLQQAS